MTTFDSIEIAPRRLANLTRLIAVSIAAVALIALSFVLGRATMDHTTRTTTTPAAVQLAFAPVAGGATDPETGCHSVHHPC